MIDSYILHAVTDPHFIKVVLLSGGFAQASWIWAEITRDLFHVLGHKWPWLAVHHNWHHQVFNRDMSITSKKLYQESHWHHDFPEALIILGSSFIFLCLSYIFTRGTGAWVGSTFGTLYALWFLYLVLSRALGNSWAIAKDLNHHPTEVGMMPSHWTVNWAYHQRHHFENPKAYYSGILTFVDKILGTALSLRGKRVAVTGASGDLETSLVQELIGAGAKVVVISSSHQDAMEIVVGGKPKVVETVSWAMGEEDRLAELFSRIDILVLNHGVKHHDWHQESASNSFEVNTLSTYRLLEMFLSTVRNPMDMVRKEAWVFTSDTEIASGYDPLHEISKQALGDLVTLKRLNAPCIMRKVVLGRYRGSISPNGFMSADWVARQVVNAVKRDTRNIIVSHRLWIYLYFPFKEWMASRYYRRFSQHSGLGHKNERVNSSVEQRGFSVAARKVV
jgi:hypothetical protein